MNYSFKETVLFVDNVSVKYDDNVTIIKDISIIEKDVVRSDKDSTAQIIAIVGRSGRGKSTLLKAITGLIKPASGQILVKDFSNMNDPNSAKVVEAGDVGLVDQRYTLFRHKTVEQILSYALRNKGLSETDKKNKINEYLEKWGLLAFKDKYPCELSGGQKQRTAIIEQLFASDKLLVLDEPFSGLDVGNIRDVKQSFELLNDVSEYNTVIFTTHDIDLAVELAQVIYVIGYPTIDSQRQNYGTVVAKYDLREMGLAWKEFSNDHMNLSKEIINVMLKS